MLYPAEGGGLAGLRARGARDVHPIWRSPTAHALPQRSFAPTRSDFPPLLALCSAASRLAEPRAVNHWSLPAATVAVAPQVKIVPAVAVPEADLDPAVEVVVELEVVPEVDLDCGLAVGLVPGHRHRHRHR